MTRGDSYRPIYDTHDQPPVRRSTDRFNAEGIPTGPRRRKFAVYIEVRWISNPSR